MNCDGFMTEDGCRLVIVAQDPTKTSDAHRATVKAWLDARTDVEVSQFSELEDLWY